MPRTPAVSKFDINASVVFRLGQELITDVVQALVELVKNSYDADATWVKVTIDTQAQNKWGRRYAAAKGAILVEDDGHGMDQAAIDGGWLTIANSPKREQKKEGRPTPRGRTPLGDKGLGRLGSQRLARNVEIITHPSSTPTTEHYVAFSWSDFLKTANLRDVPVEWQQKRVSKRKPGTKLILSGLREPETWQGERYLRDLQRKLSRMISPFQEYRDFRVHLEVDGKRIALSEVAQRVRETAQLRYRFAFTDDGVFDISGSVRLNYLRPRNKHHQQLFRSLCSEDGGAQLYEFLATKAKGNRPRHFGPSQRPGWFAEFGDQRVLDDLGGVRFVDGSAASPGRFHGEVDSVSLASADIRDDVFDRQSDYRRLVRDLSGIRVYRDGFGIRVGDDWLGLGKQWTGGSSYYGLRPGNVIGYVAISHNPHLVETTSREGFQVTPHYENFVDLLSEFVLFAGNSQEYLRRGVLQFLDEHLDRDVGVDPEDTHAKITTKIDDIVEDLGAKNRKIRGRAGSLRSVAAKASETLDNVRVHLDRPSSAKDRASASALAKLEAQLGVVSAAATDTETLLEEVSAALVSAREIRSMRDVLDRRWATLKDEVTALYESVSLGLTAEVLAHEIHNIADRLAKKSSMLRREVDRGLRKASIIAYIEHVRSSVAAMRKQLAHLTPSLRYLRELRESIDVFEWATELAAFHNEHRAEKGIAVVVRQRGSKVFAVKMNKGKLTQVVDNLVLNATYWIGEAMRAGTLESGEITIVVDAPVMRITDNGRGVDPSVEETLFNPFVTTKRINEGRGLGLFVARQLLDSESCGIILLPARNAHGRRHIFEIDLSGAVSH